MSQFNLGTLLLVNFKGFSGTHKLPLGRLAGLYLVCGDNKQHPELGANGCGKSTIFDALFWVLWGKTIRDNKPGAEVVPWKGDKHVCVELSFEREGPHVLSRKRNPNELLFDGVTIAQDEIADIIGMSEETFRRTIILGQFGTLFLDLRPEQQAEMFSEALRLGMWLQAADRASQAAKSAKADAAIRENEAASIASAITELDQQMADAKERADGFEKEQLFKIGEARRKIEPLTKEAAILKAKLGAIPTPPNVDKRIASITKLIEALPEAQGIAMNRARKAAEPLAKCPKCKQPIPDDKLTKQLQEIEASINKQRDEYFAELKRIQNARQKENTAYQDKLAAWNSINDRAINIARAIALLHREIKEAEQAENPHDDIYNRAKHRRQQKRKELAEAKANLAQGQAAQSIAEYWVKAFKEIRLSIVDDALLELEIAANRHAELLGLRDWLIAFDTERETKSGKVSYSFTVWITPPDTQKPVKYESYSGGESQRLQLAVAFGLSEVLLSRAGVDPNMECLDEPTRGLSPEGVYDLLEHLRDRALELDRAIYVVEHHALDKGLFDKVLMVEKTAKGSRWYWT